jgi:hypothetical protein
MNIEQLQNHLAKLIDAGVDPKTPIVIPIPRGEDEDVDFYELEEANVAWDVNHMVDNRPKCACVYKTATAVVLECNGNGTWPNSSSAESYTTTTHYALMDEVASLPDFDVMLAARRWRALVGSTAIRILGNSGCRNGDEGAYAHFGMEVWTHHSPGYDLAYGKQVLENYADKMHNVLVAQQTLTVDVKGKWEGDDPTGAVIVGENTHMTVMPRALDGLATRVSQDGLANASRALVIAHGVSENVTITYEWKRLPVVVNIAPADDDRLVVDWVVCAGDVELSLLALDYSIYALLDRGRGDADPTTVLKAFAAKHRLQGDVNVRPVYAD